MATARTPSEGSEPRLEPGTQFGKYRIVRKIGEGGMATIYLASNVGPDGFSKPCALKVIRAEYSARPEINRMLVQEAKVAGLLNHPNIVQVFDFGKHGDLYYLTMEWIDGATLGETLLQSIRSGTPLAVVTAAQIGISIAEALAYLQDGVQLDGQIVNLVHRDVTPSNVLISTSGAVKLTDFGIVKVLEAPTVTNVGVVKGKYAYMSPEQLRGDPIDHRSDIFALGVILFELVTRQRLFRRKTLASTVAAVHAARVPTPSTINPEVPPELDRVILRALAKDQTSRYQSARDIIEDLWPIASVRPKRGASELTQIIHQLPKDASGQRTDPRTATAPAKPKPKFDAEKTPVMFEQIDMIDARINSKDEMEDLEALAGAPENIADEVEVSKSGANGAWTEPGSADVPQRAETGAQSVPARRDDNTLTIFIIAVAIIATIVFWTLVLR